MPHGAVGSRHRFRQSRHLGPYLGQDALATPSGTNPFPLVAALAALVCAAPPALAQASWVAHEAEARATLPAVQEGTAVTGATLSCEAQRWRLDLTLAEGTTARDGDVVVGIDRRTFELKAVATAGGLAIALPRAAIEPLKAGIRLRLDFAAEGEEGPGEAAFALRGSRVAITAAQERCSLRDMSAYTPVTFTPFTSYMKLARDLRKDDTAGFRLSTASEPRLDAAMAEFDDGRRVLFTRLCGSSWYYGASGCNVTGFAPETEGEGWRAVYDSENVHLHTDPAAVTDGWPDIVTLPVRTGGAGLVWRWDGKAYALKGELPEDDEDTGVETARE